MSARPILLIDLDNTLVHSRIDFLGIRTAIIERLLATGSLAEPPADPRERSIPEWMALAEGHDAALAEELWQVVDRFERDGMLAGSVEDDVVPALAALRQAGFALGVLTNNSLVSANAALERFDLRRWFDAVFARGVVPALKPDGGGIAYAHQRLGGGPTWMLGDASIDGLATERAGVGARFIAFRANPADLARRGVHPWASVSSFADLPGLLAAPA